MVVQKIENPAIEIQRAIQENIKAEEAGSFKNPILSRCVEKHIDPSELARQAYDRMHHRHSRS